MTRRALVLTDEAAGHPFLRSLPPHVRREADPVTAREHLTTPQGWGLADLRQWLTTYCATFVAVIVFFG